MLGGMVSYSQHSQTDHGRERSPLFLRQKRVPALRCCRRDKRVVEDGLARFSSNPRIREKYYWPTHECL